MLQAVSDQCPAGLDQVEPHRKTLLDAMKVLVTKPLVIFRSEGPTVPQ